MALSTQRFSLRLMDAAMLYAGFRWQQTDEPKREEAPDYLFGPVEGDDRIEGDLDKWSFSRSLSSWLDLTRARSGGSSRGGVIGPDHPKSKAVRSVTRAWSKTSSMPRLPRAAGSGVGTRYVRSRRFEYVV